MGSVATPPQVIKNSPKLPKPGKVFNAVKDTYKGAAKLPGKAVNKFKDMMGGTGPGPGDMRVTKNVGTRNALNYVKNQKERIANSQAKGDPNEARTRAQNTKATLKAAGYTGMKNLNLGGGKKAAARAANNKGPLRIS